MGVVNGTLVPLPFRTLIVEGQVWRAGMFVSFVHASMWCMLRENKNVA